MKSWTSWERSGLGAWRWGKARKLHVSCVSCSSQCQTFGSMSRLFGALWGLQRVSLVSGLVHVCMRVLDSPYLQEPEVFWGQIDDGVKSPRHSSPE